MLPLAATAVDASAEWLEFRPTCGHSFLFTTRDGRPMLAKDLQRMFGRTVARAGTERERVTLHTLRHALATLFLRKGVDVRTRHRLLERPSRVALPAVAPVP